MPLMKKLLHILLFFAGLILFSSCGTTNQAYVDDIYYNPKKVARKQAKQLKQIQDSVAIAHYSDTTNGDFILSNYNDYEYANRLKKFQDDDYEGNYFDEDASSNTYVNLNMGVSPYAMMSWGVGFGFGYGMGYGYPYYDPFWSFYPPYWGYMPPYWGYPPYYGYYPPYYGCCYDPYPDYPSYPINPDYPNRRGYSYGPRYSVTTNSPVTTNTPVSSQIKDATITPAGSGTIKTQTISQGTRKVNLQSSTLQNSKTKEITTTATRKTQTLPSVRTAVIIDGSNSLSKTRTSVTRNRTHSNNNVTYTRTGTAAKRGGSNISHNTEKYINSYTRSYTGNRNTFNSSSGYSRTRTTFSNSSRSVSSPVRTYSGNSLRTGSSSGSHSSGRTYSGSSSRSNSTFTSPKPSSSSSTYSSPRSSSSGSTYSSPRPSSSSSGTRNSGSSGSRSSYGSGSRKR